MAHFYLSEYKESVHYLFNSKVALWASKSYLGKSKELANGL